MSITVNNYDDSHHDMKKQLHNACLAGKYDLVQRILLTPWGQSLIAGKNDGREPILLNTLRFFDVSYTLLHIACFSGQTDVVKLLVDLGADVNATNHDGHTALHIACSEGYTGVIQTLLDLGADVNAACSGGSTPLHLATLGCHSEAVSLLLKFRAETLEDKAGINPLFIACGKNQTEIVVKLLHGRFFSHSDQNVKILYVALQHSSFLNVGLALLVHCEDQITRFRLLEDVLCKAYADSETAVCLKVLRLSDSDIRLLPYGRDALLHVAAFGGHTDMVNFLMRHGANVDTMAFGCYPLHFACNGAKEIVRLLIMNGAEVDAKDERGRTPLLLASFYNAKDCMLALLEHGADVNARMPEDGSDALHIACLKGDVEAVELLLRYDVEMNVFNASGEIPHNPTFSTDRYDVEMNVLNASGETPHNPTFSTDHDQVFELVSDLMLC